jgi:hypothetical protein
VATIPPDSACSNGIDDDGDGLTDFGAGATNDPGCITAADRVERQAGLHCDDGVDNDGDGLADFHADPGCESSAATRENPKCDDDVDNDGDGKIDWNGPGEPDPQCSGKPYKNREAASSCGLGAEVAMTCGLIAVARRRWRGNARARA